MRTILNIAVAWNIKYEYFAYTIKNAYFFHGPLPFLNFLLFKCLALTPETKTES